MENQRGFLWKSLDWAGLRSGAEVQWSLIDDQGFHSERKDGQVLTDIQGTHSPQGRSCMIVHLQK